MIKVNKLKRLIGREFNIRKSLESGVGSQERKVDGKRFRSSTFMLRTPDFRLQTPLEWLDSPWYARVQ